MPINIRSFRAAVLLLAIILLSACADAAAPQTPSISSASPSATETITTATATAQTWRFPEGSTIAGVDVSGRTPATAVKLVSVGLQRWQTAVPLQSDQISNLDPDLAIVPWRVGLTPDVRAMVQQAEQQARAGQPIDVEWQPEVDQATLRAELEQLAPAFEQIAATDVVTDEKAITTTFTFRARDGVALDVDATADLLTPYLIDRSEPLSETVVLTTTPAARPPMAELERVLRAHAEYWDGVAGFYVHDLETGETLGINQNTVFSGASVMKVPIMIYVYSRLGELDDQQQEWMEGMIIDSDNIDANALLAAAYGSQGTEAALEGVNEMTDMMRGLGLEHTYQLIPYESGEWLIQQSKLPAGGPAREGEPPYTEADGYLRTTPSEMGQLFTMLAQCADGEGKLLETYSDTLSQDLCVEMMAWLERPHDEERMVAGIPQGVPVAHKGGWIDDMQSDVGIVSSPNGRYVAVIYIWTPDGYATDEHASPSPYLGDFSHTIYTFFNPESVE